MSLKAHSIPPVPEETAQVARASFPQGNLYMTMRDTFGPVYEDTQFVDLFPSRGQPAECPWRLALVTIMQFFEDLTDRQAADAVRARIDWKYALSLCLDDAGFDFTVLIKFRTRLIEGGAEHRLFETMLEAFRDQGLLKSGGHQRTDSTHILSAVRSLNRIELCAETLRHALETLSVVAPDWLKTFVPADWFERYRQPFYHDRLPSDQAERLAFVSQVGIDGHTLLFHIDTHPELNWLREVPALFTLRIVWIQQFYDDSDTIHWRDEKDLAPPSTRIGSPYDPQSRSAKKRDTRWFGYKVHLSETCDEDIPHLFTHVDTRPAPEQNYLAIEPIHQKLKARDLLPKVHLVDSAYISAVQLIRRREHFGIDLLGTAMPDVSWQASASEAFDLTHFHIDWKAEKVTCPQGKESRYWRPATDRYQQPIIQIYFHPRDCAVCAVRSLCTRSTTGGRTMTLKPEKEYRALQAARERQKTNAFQLLYNRRAGVEGTISQGVNALGMRRVRYRGQVETHLQVLATATAINVKRAVAWIMEQPRATTRTSRFAAVVA